MEGLVPCNSSDRKIERQPISVPFVWEEKPGTPKKDWKPSAQPITRVGLPVKLVASIPFAWEEKPGTPLPSFSQSRPETEPSLPQMSSSCSSRFPSPLPVKLVASVPFEWEEKPGKPFPIFSQSQQVTEPAPPEIMSISFPSPPRSSSSREEDWSGNYGDIEYNSEEDGIPDSELDTCSFVTGDSFSSAPSLLANGMMSSTALSTAVPEQQSSLAQTTISAGQIQTHGSPETDSSTSSYATGTRSLAGAAFLEWLFPLLAPQTGKDTSHATDIQNTDLTSERNGSVVRRPLLTLGEMIMMSRRMSYKRKANNIHKQPSMDLMGGNALGCWPFGPGNAISITGLQRKWRRHLQLKLM